MSRICFYHRADLDGFCSGAIVKRRFPDCVMVGIDYCDEFPWGVVPQGADVYMVDFSLPMRDMVRLSDLARLHWIDHHKTAIDAAAEFGFLASGWQLLEIGKAGCELTWEQLFPSEIMPKSVYLLGRYDVWDHVPGAVEFQYGMRLFQELPEASVFWNAIFTNKNYVDYLLSQGEMVYCYQQRENKKYAEAYAFPVDFSGLRFIALNRGMSNSLVFKDVYRPEEHDAMLLFAKSEKGWKVSLYSDKEEVDVSAVAKANGGGGHRGAAGFMCDSLPFSL